MNTRKKRRPDFHLRPDMIRNILRYRAKGFTLQAIAGKFALGSKQKTHKVIKENANNPEFADLYKEIEKTRTFLDRPL